MLCDNDDRDGEYLCKTLSGLIRHARFASETTKHLSVDFDKSDTLSFVVNIC